MEVNERKRRKDQTFLTLIFFYAWINALVVNAGSDQMIDY